MASGQGGDNERVVAILEEQGWWARLTTFAAGLAPGSPPGTAGMRAAAAAFLKAERPADAEIVLRRLSDGPVRPLD